MTLLPGHPGVCTEPLCAPPEAQLTPRMIPGRLILPPLSWGGCWPGKRTRSCHRDHHVKSQTPQSCLAAWMGRVSSPWNARSVSKMNKGFISSKGGGCPYGLTLSLSELLCHTASHSQKQMGSLLPSLQILPDATAQTQSRSTCIRLGTLKCFPTPLHMIKTYHKGKTLLKKLNSRIQKGIGISNTSNLLSHLR